MTTREPTAPEDAAPSSSPKSRRVLLWTLNKGMERESWITLPPCLNVQRYFYNVSPKFQAAGGPREYDKIPRLLGRPLQTHWRHPADGSFAALSKPISPAPWAIKQRRQGGGRRKQRRRGHRARVRIVCKYAFDIVLKFCFRLIVCKYVFAIVLKFISEIVFEIALKLYFRLSTVW